LKEPIAFFGGVFAGLLQLDLNEEPLREWVAWTSEAAGLDLWESPSTDNDDSIPEDIQIDWYRIGMPPLDNTAVGSVLSYYSCELLSYKNVSLC
jgi:hypothetical protein